jgi:DNA-binding NarL/FixJ family response regulator
VIRVVLVDDERLIREGLRKLLELGDGITVVAEAADGEAGTETIEEHKPDVVLLDVRMPRLGGLDLLARLRAGGHLPPTLVLTTFDEPALLLDAVRRGARGFLPKDVSLEELRAAIEALARGGTWFQPTLTASLREGLLDQPARHRHDERLEALTDRETEVLRLVAGGLSNREIAQTLHTAEGTVKNQVSSALSKLGVKDRTVAVLKAIEAGLL